MTTHDIARLKSLADLMLDHRLGQLRKATEAKSHSEAALAALARPVAEPENLAGAAGALAALAYHRWADARRAEINQVLARQTHDWMLARDDAQLAFGRAEALRRLSQKPPGKTPR